MQLRHALPIQHRLLHGLRALVVARATPRPAHFNTRPAAATAAATVDAPANPSAAPAPMPLPPPPPLPPRPSSGLILGIESSCDDTGVAVVTTSGRILGESLATQAEIHAAWGGVVPKLAQEAHEAAIDGCVEEALAAAGITADQLDGVAVTIGPGLSLCLRVGVLKARQLAATHQLPLIPVHHMEAHALVARLGATNFAAAAAAAEAAAATVLGNDAGQQQQQHVAEAIKISAVQAAPEEAAAAGGAAVAASGAATAAGGTPAAAAAASQLPAAAAVVEFPFLCLLISGGHNLLLMVEGIGQYAQLGTTLDDALGEAYDKVARLLGLDLNPSGGAALEAFALQGNPDAYPFSVPMQRRPSCDFSYAGLKTAVRLCIEEHVPEGPTEANRGLRADIAASFQRVAVKHLEERCRRAVQWAAESHPQARHLVVAGGVASNRYIRGRLSQVAEGSGLKLVCPPPRLCTDNGVMVAWAGVERLQLGLFEPPPAAVELGEGEWVDLRPRWPLTDRKDPRSYSAPRSAKKKRVFTSLTQLMQQEKERQSQQQNEMDQQSQQHAQEQQEQLGQQQDDMEGTQQQQQQQQQQEAEGAQQQQQQEAVGVVQQQQQHGQEAEEAQLQPGQRVAIQ